MKNNAKKKLSREAETTLSLVRPLAEVIRQELREFVIGQGMAALGQMLEEERTRLCGPAYGRGHGSSPSRAGSAQGELVMGGRRVRVKRPRVRDEEGEVALRCWEDFSAVDPLDDRALEQMMVGVSTRKYERSLEPLGGDVLERGTSRSAVSRRFKAITEKRLHELLSQDLGELPMAAIMIDGIHIDEHVILIALGIDEGGQKHLLGLWEGATEHHKVCLSLLQNLVRRNLDVQRSTLFVIDGSGALRKAIRTVFGEYALVQRCQVHKAKNVRDHLPKEMQQSVRKAMRDAYQARSVAAAKTRLVALAKQLATEHPGAAASLREGLDETLTVKGMGLTSSLERTLSTTNPIENLNGGVRDVTRRVKRWRGGSMILRWVAASALDRQKTFRRLRGYRAMPTLVAFLRRNDTRLHTDVDQATEVA
jgi:transposase-like protein